MTGALAAGLAGLLAVPALVAVALGGAAGALLTPAGAANYPGGGTPGVSRRAAAEIPPAYLRLYQQAASTCPGLGWPVLAAIGTIESGNGTNLGPSSAGAIGPMQFEPATFAVYAEPVPAGGQSPASAWDPVDAVYAAARDLCANGAAGGKNIPAAIWAYNHATWYVRQVLALAARYTAPAPAPAPTPPAAAGRAVGFALAQVGVPYRWGGTSRAGGFDCSGLIQAAYTTAGLRLPRTAQAQYTAGPRLPAGAPLAPGDLVFFGAGPAQVSHVGIYVGRGLMVDAPRTGALVRVEPAGWSDYLGATRPAAPTP